MRVINKSKNSNEILNDDEIELLDKEKGERLEGDNFEDSDKD
eukprot:CAMPEP_0119052230 /NCGR_PEP_ID=MMETSP1177-20130426/73599_1 /TAXON_ID=2985 /ORGANISM="Ochromonas sp, Strain CCMP1899" /LENGTH=41 /DNA_ID= /DNA_START= /DNA_END= /DNA_ORIENTATION=